MVGFRHPHLTVLTPELTPDTLLGLPGEAVVSNLIGRFADGVVLSGAQTGGTRLHFMNGVGAARWAVEPGPQEIFEKPYWASVTGFFVEASGERLFVANPILYPIMILDRNGDRTGEIGTPPPSFRPVPELEFGALAHTGSMDGSTQNRLEQWLESVTVITGIHVIRDRWLVVVHGRIGTNPPFPPFRRHDLTLDLYDLPAGEKLLEDVPLPGGARVLGGGTHLHVQVSQSPDRWTIVRFDVSGS